jgi:hypothetical protein
MTPRGRVYKSYWWETKIITGRVYKSYWWETKIITEPAPTETRFLVHSTQSYHKSAHLLTTYYRCNILDIDLYLDSP